jgi:hypothetical protein
MLIVMMLSILMFCYAKCHYDECLGANFFLPRVIMVSILMLSVIMLSIFILTLIKPSVVKPGVLALKCFC